MGRTPALIGLIFCGLLGFAQGPAEKAQTEQDKYAGPALSTSDVILLLKLKIPEERIRQIIAVRGRGFEIREEASTAILKAGGEQLLGYLSRPEFYKKSAAK